MTIRFRIIYFNKSYNLFIVFPSSFFLAGQFFRAKINFVWIIMALNNVRISWTSCLIFQWRLRSQFMRMNFLKTILVIVYFIFVTKTIFSQQKENILFKFLEGDFFGNFLMPLNNFLYARSCVAVYGMNI